MRERPNETSAGDGFRHVSVQSNNGRSIFLELRLKSAGPRHAGEKFTEKTLDTLEKQ